MIINNISNALNLLRKVQIYALDKQQFFQGFSQIFETSVRDLTTPFIFKPLAYSITLPFKAEVNRLEHL